MSKRHLQTPANPALKSRGKLRKVKVLLVPYNFIEVWSLKASIRIFPGW
jgi:hypothetical protein